MVLVAGLVLMYESGLVVLDLADIVHGGHDKPHGSVLHSNRRELLPLLLHCNT